MGEEQLSEAELLQCRRADRHKEGVEECAAAMLALLADGTYPQLVS